MSRTPVLFLGHGSPMNAIEDNAWSRDWARLGRELPRPKAILMISAHWETRGASAVSAASAPETIHDFGGFPQALFDVRYPAPGDPALAARVAERLSPDPVVQHPTRGLDHGAWGVLRPMYPDADIPVVQLSLDRARPDRWHYEAGRRLAPLRDEGVMILGSGDIVHNLRAIDFRRPETLPWAERFNETAKALILAGDHDPLIDWRSLGPDAEASINSAEHYLPLLYVLGAAGKDEPVSFFNDDVFAAISMTGVKVGEGGQ
ncbi:4,5-DOPA dioxygenase extradiol [Caulobacter segnis]|uniref:Extradiol ring-cleavage dioxygenase class III protein subunit B n=2 Tax=Caulobacter segnis TaxID=88688 RepID=D5VN12_CAUST|nr:4,5-DOPA dioxygenase extradiol [Caulobacter segnis]ADG11885.1 Extradiol ring-cleavage dioxygenase class III protein subunit B [Caulobacter segnis ATCC 21756]AVQ03518.1 4,5-DOPA dioxygenase extradiol [Caulobacter segnis]